MPIHPRDRLARKIKDDIKFLKQVPLHPHERPKRKSILENYDALAQKNKNEDVTFIKPVPLHPQERKKKLEKFNEKVHFVREISGVRLKKITKTKRKIDKMKEMTDQIEASLDNTSKLMTGDFNFDPKKY